MGIAGENISPINIIGIIGILSSDGRKSEGLLEGNAMLELRKIATDRCLGDGG
jgi:hypothetical protein